MLGQPRISVDGFRAPPAGVDLEVQVRAGGHPGGADIAEVLPGGDRLPFGDVDAVLPHVRVIGRDPLPLDGVFDDDEPAVPAGVLRQHDDTVCGGEDRGAVCGGEIAAGVEGAFPGDRGACATRTGWCAPRCQALGLLETRVDPFADGDGSRVGGVVRRFDLDGWNVADLAVQAPVVEPVDVFGDRELEVIDALPRAAIADQLCLEQRVERYRERIVVTIAPASDGRDSAGVGESLGVADGTILTGLNRWKQHLIGGCCGTTIELDEGSDWPGADAIALAPGASSCEGAGVLGEDRHGLAPD